VKTSLSNATSSAKLNIDENRYLTQTLMATHSADATPEGEGECEGVVGEGESLRVEGTVLECGGYLMLER
jgi:hypothetical protein